jgi:hypothetical protein
MMSAITELATPVGTTHHSLLVISAYMAATWWKG